MGGQQTVEMQKKKLPSISTEGDSNQPTINMKDYVQSKEDRTCCLTHHCLILNLLYSKSMTHLYPKSNPPSKSMVNSNAKQNSEDLKQEHEANITDGDRDCDGSEALPQIVRNNSHTRTLTTILSEQSGFTFAALKDCETASKVAASGNRQSPSCKMNEDTDDNKECPVPVFRRRNTPWPGVYDKLNGKQAKYRYQNESGPVEINPSERRLMLENSDAHSDNDNEQNVMIGSFHFGSPKLKSMDIERGRTTTIVSNNIYVD